MALIKCPECGKEISDKATACVNCGCPLSAIIEQPTEAKTVSLEKDLNSQITELQSRVNEDRDKNTYSKTNTTAVQNNEVSMPQSNMVYVTDTGKKYHRDGCQYLKKSKINEKDKTFLKFG